MIVVVPPDKREGAGLDLDNDSVDTTTETAYNTEGWPTRDSQLYGQRFSVQSLPRSFKSSRKCSTRGRAQEESIYALGTIMERSHGRLKNQRKSVERLAMNVTQHSVLAGGYSTGSSWLSVGSNTTGRRKMSLYLAKANDILSICQDMQVTRSAASEEAGEIYGTHGDHCNGLGTGNMTRSEAAKPDMRKLSVMVDRVDFAVAYQDPSTASRRWCASGCKRETQCNPFWKLQQYKSSERT
jgi:hypothetical protein